MSPGPSTINLIQGEVPMVLHFNMVRTINYSKGVYVEIYIKCIYKNFKFV